MYRIVQKGFTLSGSKSFVMSMKDEFPNAPTQKLQGQQWHTLQGTVSPVLQKTIR